MKKLMLKFCSLIINIFFTTMYLIMTTNICMELALKHNVTSVEELFKLKDEPKIENLFYCLALLYFLCLTKGYGGIVDTITKSWKARRDRKS